MSSLKLISVIVPARDAEATLPAALDGLADQEYEGSWEVVVADNGSSDGTGAVAERGVADLPGGRVIDAGRRVGAGAARNDGAAASGGELLAFCDADDRPEPGWLAGLAGAWGEADLITGPLRLDRLNSPALGAVSPTPPSDRPMVAHGFLPFASSSNCGVGRAAFDAVGGFDEDFVTGQDVELSWRLQLAGYKLGFAPDAVVQRRLRDGVSATVRQRLRWGQANARLYSRYAEHGMPAADLGLAAREWARMLVASPAAVVSTERRLDLVPRLSLRAGQLLGSVRHGVIYP